MGIEVYVGNLPFSTTDQELHPHLSTYGAVVLAQINLGRYTGRLRGFGFVVMRTQEEAQQAINACLAQTWVGEF
jgi:RNA recognition motif-containing protein